MEDGSLDRFPRSPTRMNALKYLLREAPELFPVDKVHIFRQIATELEMNGRQITPIEKMLKIEPTRPESEWCLQTSKLAYRWGLTDMQLAWPEESFSVAWQADNNPLESEWKIPSHEITYKSDVIKLNDAQLAVRPQPFDNNNVLFPILGF